MPDTRTNPTTAGPPDRSRGRVVPTRLPRIDTRLVLAIVISVVFAVDQITKALAVHALSSGPITLGGVRLHLVANRGILLGFPAPTWIVVLATAGVVVVALRSVRESRLTTALAYGLLAGGAMGNVFDRFQSRHDFPSEAVVDWISVGRVTFNLADMFLVAGVVMLAFVPSPRDSEKVS